MKSSDAVYTIPFQELDRHSLAKVGGKGANLGEMTQAEFPVPPGFCVTTDAYLQFLEGCERERIDAFFEALESLDPLDLKAVASLGSEIREYLKGTVIPEDVAASIGSAWEQTDPEASYAVRSSATAEDLPGASFAGQQDTYLHIIGKDSIVEHVRACWASLFTDRAIIYRMQNGFPHREVLISVVVQKMILPDVSGILFTVDPVSQHRKILSIDAGFGLGEALVSGTVSADSYKVHKESFAITSRTISEKTMAIRPKPGGGTFEEQLSEEQSQKQVLTDAQIEQLSKLAVRIEEHYGSPQDIEWCMEGDALYIVQSRPITSLYPTLDPLNPDGTLRAYICFNHLQVMTDAMPKLAVSTFMLLMPFGKAGKLAPSSPYMASAGGRVYIDVTEILRNPKLKNRYLTVFHNLDEMIALSLKDFVEYPQFKKEAKTAYRFGLFGPFKRFLFPAMSQLVRVMLYKDPRKAIDRVTEGLLAYESEIQRRLDKSGGFGKKLRLMHDTLGLLFYRMKAFIPFVLSGVLGQRMLARLCGTDMNDPDIQALNRGLVGNVTTDMDLAIGDLADVARAHPDVRTCIQGTEPSEILEKLEDLKGGKHFLEAFQSFLDEYGFRANSEINIAQPRWHESPEPVLQMIRGNLVVEDIGGHRRHHEELGKEAEKAGKRLIARAGKGIFGFFKAWRARRLVSLVRGGMRGREHPKFFMIRFFGMAKKLILQIGEKLEKEGDLSNAKDIFHLEWSEILAIFESPGGADNLKTLVQERKESFARHKELYPPGLLTSEGEHVVAQPDFGDIPEGALGGSRASAGVIEGRARVILDPAKDILHAGEILVAPFTDPGWTPLFVHAAGLVMEVGGELTHGSVVAREYGIPAVVCVRNATKKIQSGQWIRVDGDRGYVEFIDEPLSSSKEDETT